jgi:prevent-host-death family protein
MPRFTMKTIPISTACASLSAIVSRSERDGTRVLLSRDGKCVAAIVPVADLELLERFEEAADVAALRSALAETKRLGEKPISWKRARASQRPPSPAARPLGRH